MQADEKKDVPNKGMRASHRQPRPPLPLSPSLLRHRSGDRLVVCAAEQPERAELEGFLRSRYRAIHGAEIANFFPVLLALRDADGRLQGVAGYRPAAGHRLFLEQYLERPVDQILSDRLGWPVRRADLAEIGNFAALGCRRGERLVELLIEFLDRQGHLWAAFTGTRTIRLMMKHMGIPLHELAMARRQQLRRSAENWGNYYGADPRVVLAAVPAVVPEQPAAASG